MRLSCFFKRLHNFIMMKKIDTKNIFTKIFELFLNLFKENELYYTDNKFITKILKKNFIFISLN